MTKTVDYNSQQSHEGFRVQICQLAKLLGWRVYWTWKSFHSPKGFPDLVLVKHPRLIFAELKVKKDKLRSDQKLWLEELEKCPGNETYLWRPENFENIKDTLEGNL